MAKRRPRSDDSVEITPAQLARALGDFSNAAQSLSMWAIGLRRVVLTLDPDARMKVPKDTPTTMSGPPIDDYCPPPAEDCDKP